MTEEELEDKLLALERGFSQLSDKLSQSIEYSEYLAGKLEETLQLIHKK